MKTYNEYLFERKQKFEINDYIKKKKMVKLEEL